MVIDVLVGVPVDDFETACAWYEIFFGCPPHVAVKPGESAWRVEGTSWIRVVADGARAGSALVTLHVDDLKHHVGLIAMRGIAPDSIETLPGEALRAKISDPAGNTIVMEEHLAA